MNIIISNKFSNQLKSLNIEIIKEMNGEFTADQIVATLDNIFYDHIIFDITALKDNMKIENIQKLSAVFDMSKVILLLDDNNYFLTQEFISSIISIGIYNFTRNIEGVEYLFNNPNSYKNVMKYHKVDANVIEATKQKDTENEEQKQRKYNSIEEIYASTELTPAEKDAMINRIRMQESVKKAQMGGEKSEYVRKKNTRFRYALTFVILPLMIVLLTYGYHYLLYSMDSWIDPKSDFGKLFFKQIFKGGPSYATLITVCLLLIIISVSNKIISTKIKSCKSSPFKYSLIPFGIITAVFCFDAYFVHFLKDIITFDSLTVKSYMENSIYVNYKFIFYMVTCLFYIQLIFNRFKRLEFESEVGQKMTIFEKIFAIILMLVLFLPALYELFNVFDYVKAVTNIFNSIFKIKNLMIYLSILEFIGIGALLIIEIKNKINLKNVSKAEKK